MFCKLDGKLFRRSTRGSQQVQLTECQFADDAALLATTRIGAEWAILTYIGVAKSFGLTVSLPKTKLMVTGFGMEEEDVAPILIAVHDELIECVDQFPYLGSVVSSNGRIDEEVDCQIAKASKAYIYIEHYAVLYSRTPISPLPRAPSVECICSLCQAVCFTSCIWISECWTPLRRYLKRLNAFHHRNIHTVLEITNRQQWDLRLSSAII